LTVAAALLNDKGDESQPASRDRDMDLVLFHFEEIDLHGTCQGTVEGKLSNICPTFNVSCAVPVSQFWSMMAKGDCLKHSALSRSHPGNRIQILHSVACDNLLLLSNCLSDKCTASWTEERGVGSLHRGLKVRAEHV
jgi:hypothetical protein